MRFYLKMGEPGCIHSPSALKMVEIKCPQISVLVVSQGAALTPKVARLLHRHTVVSFDRTRKTYRPIEAILRLKPDVLLVDMPLPLKKWTDLIRRIKSTDHRVSILAVCAAMDAASANRVLRAGANGYFCSQESARQLLDAIYDVLSGAIYISEGVFSNPSRPTPVCRRPNHAAQLKSRLANKPGRTFVTSVQFPTSLLVKN